MAGLSLYYPSADYKKTSSIRSESSYPNDQDHITGSSYRSSRGVKSWKTGIYSATNGLSKLASSVTFGVVSFDGDKTAKELEDDVTNMVNSNSKLVQYIGNKNNPIVLRGLAAGCGAAELVGKKVVSGFCKVAEKAGKAAQTVWTVYDELNKAYGM